MINIEDTNKRKKTSNSIGTLCVRAHTSIQERLFHHTTNKTHTLSKNIIFAAGKVVKIKRHKLFENSSVVSECVLVEYCPFSVVVTNYGTPVSYLYEIESNDLDFPKFIFDLVTQRQCFAIYGSQRDGSRLRTLTR